MSGVLGLWGRKGGEIGGGYEMKRQVVERSDGVSPTNGEGGGR